MNARAIGLSMFALAALAGSAAAQPGGSEYVSGFEHAALGEATFDPAVGRRLPVRNIGSSGQDGVEIKLRTAYGGGTGIDVGGLLAAAGGEIKIKHKGWDGLIYHRTAFTSNGDGTGMITFDYTGTGVVSLHVVEYDEFGGVISEEDIPGGVASRPWVPNFTCPDGSQPIAWSRWVKLCDTCPWVEWIGWMCLGTGDVFTYEPGQHARIIVTPTFPEPAPFVPTAESMVITAHGLTGFDVVNASTQAFSDLNQLPPGTPWTAWLTRSVGGAHLDEECANPGAPCGQTERRLPVRNLGSSGEDGVRIELASRRATGFSIGIQAHLKHITLLKAYDDDGTQQQLRTTVTDPLTGETELDADFSDLGAYGYHLTLLDPTGVEVGPPGGTDIINGGPRPIFSNLCPPGSIAHFHNAGTTSNPVWVLDWCETINAFVLPGGTVVSNVATIMIEPLGATSTSGPIRGVQVLGDEDERVITDFSAVYACESDFDLNGFVNGDDADAFAIAFDIGDPSADVDGNGFTNGDDADYFASHFDAGC